MKRINQYVFIQIIKSCTLIFFIFVSIAWLLQLSRLFSYLTYLQVNFTNILQLSAYLIPNIVTIMMPFIIIFGLIIAFIKLDRDKELIAIYSLGLSLNQIKKPLILLTILISVLYIALNFYISPIVYKQYKFNEFKLRNEINLNNINISNFIQLDENLILDFEKIDNTYQDVFIKFLDKNENLIYSKKAQIINDDNKFIFNLDTGFKLTFIGDKIEKLEFKNYKITFPTKTNNIYNNLDKNTLTIVDLIKLKDLKNIEEKIFDSLISILIILLFYEFNIKKNNFNINRIFIFLAISLGALITQNLLKNMQMVNHMYLLFNSINIIILIFLTTINKYKLK